MCFVYILKSKRNGRYYIGSTKNVEKRLKEHNWGKIKSTKGLRPLEIVYIKDFSTNNEARKREAEIKSRKSRKYIEELIHRGVA